MSNDPINDGLVLPPNVKGKTRGFLEIAITEIHWTSVALTGVWGFYRGHKTPKTPDNFIGSGGVSIKIIWWGQNHQDGAVLKVSGHSGKLEKKIVHYRIHTNARLFKNYLCNCEPIEIKFTANTSNLQLGTAYARVPIEIINGCKADDKESLYLSKFRIFNPKNIHIGNIVVKFKMLLYEELNSARSTGSSLNSFHEKDIFGTDINLSDLKTCRSYRSFKADNQLPEIYCQSKFSQVENLKSISPKILDYLSGRDMSPTEETIALEEIQRTSPLNNVMDEFLSERFKMKQNDIYARLDSLRLCVMSLTLLPAGIREICVQTLASVNFTIDCRISPNLLDNIRPKYDYDVMRFYSDTYSDKSQKIIFNKDAIRAIRIVRNEINPSIIEEVYLLFTIWWRQFGSKHSRCLGTAKYEFTSLFDAGELEQTKKIIVRSCTGNIHVADLTCKVTLGTKGVHFGSDYLTFFKEDDNIPDRHNCEFSEIKGVSHLKSGSGKIENRNTDNDNIDSASNTNSNRKSVEKYSSSNKTERSDQATQTISSMKSTKGQESPNLIKKSKLCDSEEYRLLQGLLYAGSVRNIQQIEDGGYFLVCRAFWKEDATSTNIAIENNFNFLEIFPIINDKTFLDRARHNHLNLELWQKTSNTPEQMLGVVRLPLHQFFIAFRDSTITNHLCKAKLPVISIDGWVPITSPLSGEICGQLQSLLAIGTEEQLEYLKASRGLNCNQVYQYEFHQEHDTRIPVPQILKLPVSIDSERPTSCDVETQADLSGPNSINAGRARLSDLLGTFIENLAQRLPPERQTQENTLNEENSSITPQTTHQGLQIRKTSDLLDVLQKALVTPPSYNMSTRRSNSDSAIIPSSLHESHVPAKVCKILLEIESALHLPRNQPKLSSKKNSKRASGNKLKQSRITPDEEPSAYVTFQAEEGYGQMIKSHEGLVYATHVVEKSCNPSWMKRFEIAVPADLLTNDEKRFILKVWRKSSTDLAQCRLLPTPMEDSIIGFAAIDLSVLLARMPFISGWFNIVDFSGRINGQIKVNVQPLEDVMKFKEKSILKSSVIPSYPQNDASPDLNNTTLSRAIKRKFTELEEITQRLRARLFDVTGDGNNVAGGDFGDGGDDVQLDEFERDINTAAEEDEDDDINGRKNFGWLGCVPSNVDALHSECSSTSGGDSQERIQMISEYLRRTDLNEAQQEICRVDNERNRPPDGGSEGKYTKTNE